MEYEDIIGHHNYGLAIDQSSVDETLSWTTPFGGTNIRLCIFWELSKTQIYVSRQQIIRTINILRYIFKRSKLAMILCVHMPNLNQRTSN